MTRCQVPKAVDGHSAAVRLLEEQRGPGDRNRARLLWVREDAKVGVCLLILFLVGDHSLRSIS